MSDLRDDMRSGMIYVYKLICDNGGAPCIFRNLLSLSICKPHIRTSAQIGDWILGFGGKSRPELRGRLIYIAQVTAVEENGEYYAREQYRRRPDCIYQRMPAGYKYVKGSHYHGPEDIEHDLGAEPYFERARILMSKRFCYFGAQQGPSLDAIRDIYDDLPRDYVKHHAPDIRDRLERFIASVFEQFGQGKHGSPTQGDMAMKCHQSEGDDIILPRCSG
ncbi:MAG: Nmad2 family putative nucleotide modification protein [Acidithiobacillus sp.]